MYYLASDTKSTTNKCTICFRTIHVFTFLVVITIALALFIFYGRVETVLDQAKHVMEKANVFFSIMWKTLCDGSVPLLSPDDCRQLKSFV